ncbi:hypothetical protein J3F83DRAFT_731640 [Trichoderma novae-zelandiae]
MAAFGHIPPSRAPRLPSHEIRCSHPTDRRERGQNVAWTWSHTRRSLSQSAPLSFDASSNESACQQSSDLKRGSNDTAMRLKPSLIERRRRRGPALAVALVHITVCFELNASLARPRRVDLTRTKYTSPTASSGSSHLGATVTSTRFPFPIVLRVLRERTAQSRKAALFDEPEVEVMAAASMAPTVICRRSNNCLVFQASAALTGSLSGSIDSSLGSLGGRADSRKPQSLDGKRMFQGFQTTYSTLAQTAGSPGRSAHDRALCLALSEPPLDLITGTGMLCAVYQ